MIGIIDYGAGNLASVKRAFEYLDIPNRIVTSAKEFDEVSGIVLPGVGAFGSAMERLNEKGYSKPLARYIRDNRPFLGICLGMHFLMQNSDERMIGKCQEVKGLGAIEGSCIRFQQGKVPHMGWNRVNLKRENPLFKGIPDHSYFYFVHSYYIEIQKTLKSQWEKATTGYGVNFPSVLQMGSVCGVQFHPEKSGDVGLQLLKNWVTSCVGLEVDNKEPMTKSFGRVQGTFFQKGSLVAEGLTTRIIPCLDVDNGRVVKGVKFENIRDAGDPVELAKMYNEQGADEITFLDIGATYKSREILLEVVEKVSRQVFVPLTVGGGITSVADMRKVLKSGADKVSVCSAAIKNPNLLSDGAEKFGSQCIVLSIDAKRVGSTWHAFTSGGRKDSGVDAIEWAQKGEALGAGEILLNSIDQDGTQAGYDLELTKKISERVNIPVIASGGAGTMEHMKVVVHDGKADAVLLASLLHDGKMTLPEIKTFLNNKGVKIR